MKITYKHGDLLQANERFIAHGCNAQGVQNSGVAKVIREKYPEAYNVYRERYVSNGNKLEMGDTIWTENTGPHIVINIITQEFYGRDGKTYLDYDALRKGLSTINQIAVLTANDENLAEKVGGVVTSVAFPLIGAGLAGGKWSIISEIIEQEAVDFSPVVYVIDGKIPE